MTNRRRTFLALLLFLSVRIAVAQTSTYKAPPQQSFLDPDIYYAAVTGGMGTSFDGSAHPASAQFLVSAGLSTLSERGGHLGGQTFVEAGFIGPLVNRKAPAAFVSYDFGLNAVASHHAHTIFFAVGGYSYLFGESHALNFGVGFDHYVSQYRAIRVEVRDYYTFTDTPQHNVALRIGWQFAAHDP